MHLMHQDTRYKLNLQNRLGFFYTQFPHNIAKTYFVQTHCMRLYGPPTKHPQKITVPTIQNSPDSSGMVRLGSRYKASSRCLTSLCAATIRTNSRTPQNDERQTFRSQNKKLENHRIKQTLIRT